MEVGDKDIPDVVSYCYLSTDNSSWDNHVQKAINSGEKNLINYIGF